MGPVTLTLIQIKHSNELSWIYFSKSQYMSVSCFMLLLNRVRI